MRLSCRGNGRIFQHSSVRAPLCSKLYLFAVTFLDQENIIFVPKLAIDNSLFSIKDMFEPQGDAEKWIDRFNEAHEKTFSDHKSWDAFMSFSISYFTPYLKDHFVRWVKNGLPMRAHFYKNAADEEQMYVIMTYNPNTGEIVEVHGTALSEDQTENADMIAKHFSEVPENVCNLAVGTGLTASHLTQSWEDDSENRLYESEHGLPFVSVAKVSHPTSDADGVSSWMQTNAALNFDVVEAEGKDSGLCRMANLRIKKFQDTSYGRLLSRYSACFVR